MCDSFSFNKMTIFINIALIQKFQDLNKKCKNESSENFCTPANAVFSFENCHFLTHRPHKKFKIYTKNVNMKARKNFAPLQTLFSPLKIAIFWRIAPPKNSILEHKKCKNESSEKCCTLQTLFSSLKIAIFWRIAPQARPRGILCVDKIGSPENPQRPVRR